ncbi:MAG: isochorismatase family protein [Pseudomonadota bacterium]
MEQNKHIALRAGDALLLVDVQNDFLPGGALAVPHGDEVIVPLNRLIERFGVHGLPVYATRDWHPVGHCSFRERGGPWPPHCLADTRGARFPTQLALPEGAVVISKATTPDKDTYSGFEGTDLDERLRERSVQRLAIGGLATDYCVLNTVRDALKLRYRVLLVRDAIRAVEVHAGDGERAIAEMEARGALSVDSGNLA